MHIERVNSAYRLGLGIALLYLLWTLAPNLQSYANLVVRGAHQSQSVKAQRNKLSAVNLESALRQSKQFGSNSQLHCEPAAQDWDYVCSYMPTPLQSTTRLQFGVSVDATRWVKVSGVVPMGTILPSPQ
jgi:hypothetical protein